VQARHSARSAKTYGRRAAVPERDMQTWLGWVVRAYCLYQEHGWISAGILQRRLRLDRSTATYLADIIRRSDVDVL
jgi:hypothetical protein